MKDVSKTHQQSNKTLVLGGTGKTGRRVANRLQARGLPVRIGSRSGAPPFDWEDQTTWAPALRDIGSVYISYFPDLAAPGAVEAVGSFAELAVKRCQHLALSYQPFLALLAQRAQTSSARSSSPSSR